MLNKRTNIYNLYTKLTSLIVLCFFILIMSNIFIKGIPNINFKLFSLKYNSENLSMLPSIVNTINIIIIAIILSTFIGVCSAIYLEEYLSKENKIIKYIDLSIETLAGIPSIIYGLFGMLFFVVTLKIGISILSGAFTVSIMILPTIIRVTQISIKSVPIEYKMGSLALGADRLTTLKKITLPCAKKGIVVGIILNIGRIISESACFIYTSGTIAEIAGLFSSGRTLTLHMYILSSEGLFIEQANATGTMILLILIILNIITKLITNGGFNVKNNRNRKS